LKDYKLLKFYDFFKKSNINLKKKPVKNVCNESSVTRIIVKLHANKMQ